MADFYIRGDNESELEFKILLNNLTTGTSLILDKISPESIDISPSTPSFPTYSINGRSSPAVAYSGGGQRTVQFSLELHRDAFNSSSEKSASDDFQKKLDWFDALNYPEYKSSGVVPPNCICRIGNAVSIKGYGEATYSLKRPIDQYGRFMAASVSVTIIEVLNTSWSASEIESGCVSKKEVSASR